MIRRALSVALAVALTALLTALAPRAEPSAPPPAAPAPASPFADWAAVFVAGDWHAHSGGPTEAFDNARRDAAAAFQKAGFQAANMRQFSVRPDRYPQARPLASNQTAISQELDRLAAKARGGCLIYFTSHGAPQGALLGDRLLSPHALAALINRSCAQRPTVLIMSACYSGVFLPAMSGPNRMVLTAARPDRSSFGCTESDKYPYYDACLLESLPRSRDFADLGRRAGACVGRRETAEGLSPPSEPQIQVGWELRPLLPFYGFATAPP